MTQLIIRNMLYIPSMTSDPNLCRFITAIDKWKQSDNILSSVHLDVEKLIENQCYYLAVQVPAKFFYQI
jgi:hypothetical protein